MILRQHIRAQWGLNRLYENFYSENMPYQIINFLEALDLCFCYVRFISFTYSYKHSLSSKTVMALPLL